MYTVAHSQLDISHRVAGVCNMRVHEPVHESTHTRVLQCTRIYACAHLNVYSHLAPAPLHYVHCTLLLQVTIPQFYRLVRSDKYIQQLWQILLRSLNEEVGYKYLLYLLFIDSTHNTHTLYSKNYEHKQQCSMTYYL